MFERNALSLTDRYLQSPLKLPETAYGQFKSNLC